MGCGSSAAKKYEEEDAKDKDKDKDKAKITALGKVDLFKRLPDSETYIKQMAQVATSKSFAAAETIIKQGDDGSELFVIVEGSCKVEIDGNQVTTFKENAYFGEVSLTRDQARTATITALTGTKTLSITRKQFTDLGLLEKLVFPKRQAVAVMSEEEIKVENPAEKTAEDMKQIVEAMQANENLANLGTAEASLKKVAALAWIQSVSSGAKIITQNDTSADYFYVVKKGSFEITVDGTSLVTVGTKQVGSSFGELALLYSAPRAAHVTAVEDSEVWVIGRNQFKKMQRDAENEIAETYKTYLKKVKIFSDLNEDLLNRCAKAMQEKSFAKDEFVFEQGQDGDYFYILLNGKVQIIIDGKAADEKDAKDEVYPFGEKALDSDEKRAASFKIISEKAQFLALDKISYDIILKKDTAPQDKEKSSRTQIYKNDLEDGALLGCGGFGAVHLVKHKTTGETYALKALSKGFVVKSGMQASVVMEKNVQMMCDSPFIVKLYETFNGSQTLYLLLELALGGELYATYNKLNFWGKVDHAKFYVAGTVFAFEHLHEKKIIFRDLKPENLLLNTKGQVKLTDMGLAKVTIEKTFTTCGTPDYFAPEIITSKGHTKAVDWWTLGILSFELLVGHPPFESATPMQIYQKVRKGIEKVKFPAKLGADAESFIKGLCRQDPQDRMPMRHGGTKNIKNHKWYHSFDWEAMKNLTLDPPYKPKVKDPSDTHNFSANKSDLPPQIPYKDPKTGWDKDFATSVNVRPS